MSEYTQTGEIAQPYELVEYRNGDATGVFVCNLNGAWQVVAIETDREGEIIATEDVGATEDREKAVGMAEYWMDDNPDGVLGGDGGDSGLFGGVLTGGD